MSDALEAINSVLSFEGKYFDDPTAGATNFGISLRFLKTLDPLATASTIKDLTRDDAIAIYKEHFWDANNYSRIASQTLANLLLNLSVNMGAVQAHKLLQRAIRPATGITLVADGLLGSSSMCAIDYASPPALILALKCYADCYYRSLPNADKFLAGWQNRLFSIK